VGIVDPLDAPTGDRAERRSAQRFPGSETETGVMQRAPQLVANNEALDERPMVMSATSSHGEELATGARKDHVFAVDLPLNHSAGQEGGQPGTRSRNLVL
jgi:hypothetical protein